MNQADIKLWESLRPRDRNNIIDLVALAGINVAPWGSKKDGTPVKNPSENPNFCYEWAFGGKNEPIALCIWHNKVQVEAGIVWFDDNLRQRAIELDRENSTRNQAKRARKFDSLLQYAFRNFKEVRVVLLEGAKNNVGYDTSKVKYRLLDKEVWYVHDYSDDGEFHIVRSNPPSNIAFPASLPKAVASQINSSATEVLDEPKTSFPFIDQFSLPEHVEKRESVTSTYLRRPEVRQAVLNRASGVCEYCKLPGFQMENGAVFLETHHVVPLSEGGPDEEWNVVAICPNDHRRAHFGADRQEIRKKFIDFLIQQFPTQAEKISAMDNKK